MRTNLSGNSIARSLLASAILRQAFKEFTAINSPLGRIFGLEQIETFKILLTSSISASGIPKE
jgi:hypothetical protein